MLNIFFHSVNKKYQTTHPYVFWNSYSLPFHVPVILKQEFLGPKSLVWSNLKFNNIIFSSAGLVAFVGQCPAFSHTGTSSSVSIIEVGCAGS